jgi:hypothetical protein
MKLPLTIHLDDAEVGDAVVRHALGKLVDITKDAYVVSASIVWTGQNAGDDGDSTISADVTFTKIDTL